MTDAEKIDEILARLKRIEPGRRQRRIERTILAALAAWIGYREMQSSPTPAESTTPAVTRTSTTSVR